MAFYCEACPGRLIEAEDLETGDFIAWECGDCRTRYEGDRYDGPAPAPQEGEAGR